MPRSKKMRWIGRKPCVRFFKPQGIPLQILDQVRLEMDEFEAIRLADLEGMTQERAAGEMHVSRATFGRIIAAAHQKIADALTHGKAIRIIGDTDICFIEHTKPIKTNTGSDKNADKPRKTKAVRRPGQTH